MHDCVFDGTKDKFDVFRVCHFGRAERKKAENEACKERDVSDEGVEATCGTGKVAVDYFLCIGIEVYEHPQHELPRRYGVPLGA